MLYKVYIDKELIGIEEDLDDASDLLTDYVLENNLEPDGDYVIIETEGVLQ